ncbi:MAG TPA: DMT family protein [Chthoniobacterales bacterium]
MRANTVTNYVTVKTVLLLLISNIFMNLAWYGHLKFKSSPLWIAILASWGLALFEYMFQVPANRIGARQWDVAQLKILQEALTLAVFCVVAYFMFGTPFWKWNYLCAYVCIMGAIFFAFNF